MLNLSLMKDSSMNKVKFISYTIRWTQPYTLYNKTIEQELEFKISLSKYQDALKVIERVKKL